MSRNTKRILVRLTVAPLAVLASAAAVSQQPVPFAPPVRITSTQAEAFDQHLEAARASAGTEWLGVVEHMCTQGQVVTGSAQDPLIEPVRIFDNVYAIGRTSTVVYVIATSAGLVLIDSGYPDQVDSVLLPGMEQLGLDPLDIRYVFVLHGHADHYGGSCRMVASEADWVLMEDADPNSGRPTAPTRDMVAVEGEPIRLGDGMVTPFLVPGHTPGAISVIFSCGMATPRIPRPCSAAPRSRCPGSATRCRSTSSRSIGRGHRRTSCCRTILCSTACWSASRPGAPVSRIHSCSPRRTLISGSWRRFRNAPRRRWRRRRAAKANSACRRSSA